MNTEELATIFKALSDETRLQIIELLCNGEKCACKLLEAFNITQPTLSHHIKILVDAKLINDKKESKWHYYSLNKKTFEKIKSFNLKVFSKLEKATT